MKFKVKTASLLIVLVMVVGVSLFISNDSDAQEKTYKIGDRGPAGGWVFYDKGDYSNGWRYLEASPIDQSTGTVWRRDYIMTGCCLSPSFYFRFFWGSIPGARGTAIGTGKYNTQAMVKSWVGGEQIAADLCIAYRGGGKSDWFLPSRDELDLMWQNLYGKGVGDFVAGRYWSSSESGDSDFNSERFAWAETFNSFGTGDQYEISKGYIAGVRAVRAF